MTKPTEEQISAGQDYIQFYQAGFLDAWRKSHKGRLNYKELNLKCLRGFEKRFMTKIQKNIDKKEDKQNES